MVYLTWYSEMVPKSRLDKVWSKNRKSYCCQIPRGRHICVWCGNSSNGGTLSYNGHCSFPNKLVCHNICNQHLNCFSKTLQLTFFRNDFREIIGNSRYSWCSEAVTKDKFRWTRNPRLCDLIPLESSPEEHGCHLKKGRKKIVIGHNVGFDRSFVKEQYYIKVLISEFGSCFNKVDFVTNYQVYMGKCSLKVDEKTFPVPQFNNLKGLSSVQLMLYLQRKKTPSTCDRGFISN